METAAFLQQLTADGALLAAATRTMTPEASVPRLTWSAREVAVHTGAVHRWAADLVRERRTSNDTGGSAAWWPAPAELADDAISTWLVAGVDALVATLAAAPDDLEVWAFGRPAPAASFWSRRQAHGTAIHRTDLQAAAGLDVTAFDADFAQDGLRELAGFARGFRVPGRGRLALLASDGDDWLVTFDGERVVATSSSEVGAADASVAGTSSDLYRWVWNRPSAVVVDGDAEVVALWQGVRIT